MVESSSAPSRPAVGDSASFSKTISEADLILFAGVTGDTNPLHFDAVFAAESRFKGRIAHGMITAALISTVLGTKLPGPGTVYLAQSLKFRRPVGIGDTITATVTVTTLDDELPTCTLETVVTNQEGKVVLEGEARVQYP